MQEICCKTIGKRGRTTIPFCMRNALGIKNNTLLRFTRNEKQVLVTPRQMLPVIEKKIKSGEGSGKGDTYGSESKRLFN